MLTDEQQAVRKTGLGGSEIAAVLGESHFASPFDVWLSKTQGWQKPPTVDMQRGQFLEDGIARWYASKVGAQVLTEGQTVRHATVPIALCTPDRFAPTTSAPRLVSIKAPRRGGDLWGDDGSDGIPTEHFLQLQWEHAVCSSLGAVDDEMHLAALVDGELRTYVLQADRELQTWMLDLAAAWWTKHVVNGEAPSVEGSKQADAWARKKFPRDVAPMREATPHEGLLMVRLEYATQDAEMWRAQCEDIRNELKLSIGDAGGLTGSNGSVTWRANSRGVRTFKTKWTNKGSYE